MTFAQLTAIKTEAATKTAALAPAKASIAHLDIANAKLAQLETLNLPSDLAQLVSDAEAELQQVP